MSVAELNQTPVPIGLSGAQYDLLVEHGMFDHRHIELINGEVFETSPMNDAYAMAIKLANYALLRAYPPDRFTVQVQCPMRLRESSRPEPDLAVVSGSPREQSSHPRGALLVVEVSDSTLEFDRTSKTPIYAAAGISEYWIVNLNDRRLEVRRTPIQAGDASRYEETKTFGPGESISALSAPSAVIAVSELLP